MAILNRITKLFSREDPTYSDIPPPPPPIHIPAAKSTQQPASDLEVHTRTAMEDSVAPQEQTYRERMEVPDIQEIREAIAESKVAEQKEAQRVAAHDDVPQAPMMMEMEEQDSQPDEQVVAEQHEPFHLHMGGDLYSIEDLADALMHMRDDVFTHHVTADRNDFANWIRGVFHDNELADRVQACNNKDHMCSVLRGEEVAFSEPEISEPEMQPHVEEVEEAHEPEEQIDMEEPLVMEQPDEDIQEAPVEVEISLDTPSPEEVEAQPVLSIDRSPEPVELSEVPAYSVPNADIDHKDVMEAPDHHDHDDRIMDLKEKAERLRMEMTQKQEEIKQLTKDIEEHRVQLAGIHDEIDHVQFAKHNPPVASGKQEIIDQIQRVQELVLERDFTQARIIYDHAKDMLKGADGLSEEEHIELDNSLKGAYADLTLAKLQ